MALAELPLAEAQLAHVLDAVHDGVILHSDGTVIANAAAQRILGLPEGTEFRSSLFAARTLDGVPFDIAESQPVGKETMENGVGGVFRIRATALDGRELVLDGSISPVLNGVVIVFRDVTDEFVQNELNEQTLVALFDTLPTAIAVSDPATHTLLRVNTAFAELVGLPVERIAGLRPPFPWVEPGEVDATSLTPGTRTERVFRRPDGRPYPVDLSVLGVGDDGRGGPALLIAVASNLSEGHRMQQQLVQSGKLAAIGELAAGVAHEINNPLFAILGLTEFLLKEAEPGSKAEQRLELIQQTGLEIKEIVRALLDFARENAEERHVVPLEEVVRATCELVRRTNAHKGVELIDRYDDSNAPVVGSPNQLKQILLNLIANARQAMPNGGTVTVDVRLEGRNVVASVTDDGPGIPADVLPRIFEPFYTTKRLTGGTGLGLSVSLGIVEAHGGRLTVVSELGHGAEFTLSLPVADAAEVTA